MTPITELSNKLSENIDISNPEECIDIISQCDDQIFTGYKDYKNIFNDELINQMKKLSNILVNAYINKKKVIISGCGTSGRIAYLISELFENISYLISGGDSAIVLSDELPEDDIEKAVEDLKKLTEEKEFVFIGITCGLSAPYVGSQIDYCIKNKIQCALIGFNPINLTNDYMKPIIEKFIKNNGILINPIIGPESITGSSRMKGGTATYILLDIIVSLSYEYLHEDLFDEDNYIKNRLEVYQNEIKNFYYQLKLIIKTNNFLEEISESVKQEGKIYYISEQKNPGIMSIIDFSEMPDTYGSPFDQFRAFIRNGWNDLKNNEGNDIGNKSDLLNIDIENFKKKTINENDTCICIYEDKEKNLHINIRKYELNLQFNNLNLNNNLLCLKLLLNIISTYSQIKGNGAVYKNLMIATGPTNNKIYNRCIDIISEISKLDKKECEILLLKSIYEIENLDNNILEKKREEHIQRATPYSDEQKKERNIILPRAILLSKGFNLKDATEKISQETVIRNLF